MPLNRAISQHLATTSNADPIDWHRHLLGATTQARVRELLSYAPVSGLLTWRVDRNGGAYAGDVAGSRHHTGCLVIGIDGVIYQAHRIIWLWMTGEWPEGDIDHKDRNPTNNVWGNLRKATRTQNQANLIRRPNRSGFKGVTVLKTGKHGQNVYYLAKIGFRRRRIHIGCFKTPQEAHAAYVRMATELYGEYARAE